MTDQLPPSLPTTLKAHAAALQPPFSQSLHGRIITRLRQEARSGGAAPPSLAAYRPAWHWPAAAAILALGGALCLMALLKAAHNSAQPPIVINPTPAVPSTPSLALPPVQAIFNSAIDPTRARLQDSKFAYLDHDAKRFTNFVLSQLPGE